MNQEDRGYPTPAIVDYVLEALDPRTTDNDTKINALFAAMSINREETIGVIFGMTTGMLAAIEERTHGLTTAADIYDDLAAGIRCRMAAAMIEEAATDQE